MSENPSNPKQQYGDKKPNLSLVPSALDWYASVALGDGAIKYGPFNWRKSKVEAMTYVAAIRRHLARWVDRVAHSDVEMWDKDGQTWRLGGHPELAHVAACVAILADAEAGGFLIDNRPEAGPSARLERDLSVPKVLGPQVRNPVPDDRWVPEVARPEPRPIPEKYAHAMPDLDQEYPLCDCPKGKCAYIHPGQPLPGASVTCVEARAIDDGRGFDVV